MSLNRVEAKLARLLRENLDLLALWVVLMAVQPLVPVGNPLARDDLMPWMVLNLSLAALLRARPLGPGPHPMLTRRRSTFGRLLQRLVLLLAPWVLLAWTYGAALHQPLLLGGAVGGLVLVAVLLALGRSEGLTAWNPPGPAGWKLWLPIGGGVAAVLGLLGWLCGPAGPLPGGPVVRGCLSSVLLGSAFLVEGLILGRPRHLRQRLAAGQKDGDPYRPDLFGPLLALGGPSVGLFLLYLVLGDTLDFNAARAASMHVLVWAAVIWPKPEPIARACILHEVVPAGGGDAPAGDRALSFERPPEGALRFNPLKTRRIRVMHPWLVPVKGARIASLDDPVQPLWAEKPPFLRPHVLGEASFEPDPLTRSSQWDVVTLRITGQQDTSKVQTDAQTRRIVILRPFPPPGRRKLRRLATYRWERGVPADSIQVIDASVERATLRDGDLIVLSSEGVARAFEVEMGAPLYDAALVEGFRPPQLEDYVKV